MLEHEMTPEGEEFQTDRGLPRRQLTRGRRAKNGLAPCWDSVARQLLVTRIRRVRFPLVCRGLVRDSRFDSGAVYSEQSGALTPLSRGYGRRVA